MASLITEQRIRKPRDRNARIRADVLLRGRVATRIAWLAPLAARLERDAGDLAQISESARWREAERMRQEIATLRHGTADECFDVLMRQGGTTGPLEAAWHALTDRQRRDRADWTRWMARAWRGPAHTPAITVRGGRRARCGRVRRRAARRATARAGPSEGDGPPSPPRAVTDTRAPAPLSVAP